MPDFTQWINKINEHYQNVTKDGSGVAYGRLSSLFEELDYYFREHIQEITEGDVKQIIKKLKKGDTITSEDKEQIRLWIVGDAESYSKLENNFEDWKHELDRLMGEINQVDWSNLNPETTANLRGLIRDAARNISDIFYYLQQKDRVKQFEESIKEIDEQERELLINLLEQKIKSPDL